MAGHYHNLTFKTFIENLGHFFLPSLYFYIWWLDIYSLLKILCSYSARGLKANPATLLLLILFRRQFKRKSFDYKGAVTMKTKHLTRDVSNYIFLIVKTSTRGRVILVPDMQVLVAFSLLRFDEESCPMADKRQPLKQAEWVSFCLKRKTKKHKIPPIDRRIPGYTS